MSDTKDAGGRQHPCECMPPSSVEWEPRVVVGSRSGRSAQLSPLKQHTGGQATGANNLCRHSFVP